MDDAFDSGSTPIEFDGERLNELAATNHTVIGIRATDGIVILGYEHEYSPLRADPIANPARLGETMALGWTGQQQAGQHIVNHVREELIERDAAYDDADAYTVNDAITTRLAERLQPPSTPLVVSCLIASVDDSGTQLLRTVRASGATTDWRAVALGPNEAAARQFLTDAYDADTLSVGDALTLAVRTLDETTQDITRDAVTALLITSESCTTPTESDWTAAFDIIG